MPTMRPSTPVRISFSSPRNQIRANVETERYSWGINVLIGTEEVGGLRPVSTWRKISG
jgi:hypothetical protein